MFQELISSHWVLISILIGVFGAGYFFVGYVVSQKFKSETAKFAIMLSNLPVLALAITYVYFSQFPQLSTPLMVISFGLTSLLIMEMTALFFPKQKNKA